MISLVPQNRQVNGGQTWGTEEDYRFIAVDTDVLSTAPLGITPLMCGRLWVHGGQRKPAVTALQLGSPQSTGPTTTTLFSKAWSAEDEVTL